MLPSKTYLQQNIPVRQGDCDASGCVSLHAVARWLQDAASEHAERLGFGWDSLDAAGCLWVLSKLKIRLDIPFAADTADFTLYTWPLRPARFFAERCFAGVKEDRTLFSATSLWTVIDRNTRRIVSADKLNSIYRCDFDDAHCDVTADFVRLRRDESYVQCYTKTVRRSDLDVNGHVNNTNYVNYALDVLQPGERVTEAEIVFQKELLFGDTVTVYAKRESGKVYVIGERDETCFTAVLTIA